MGPLEICGDFNARCGSADDGTSGVPNRKVIDVVRNSQGEEFMDFLRGTEMCVVSGRKGKDAFTCVSGRGCSGVDYCVVGVEDFDMIENLRITTCEVVEEMRSDGVSMMVPDHSLLHRDTVLQRSRVWRGSEEIQTETL